MKRACVSLMAAIVVLAGCGSTGATRDANKPRTGDSLDCGSEDLRQTGDLDYSNEPAPEAEPVEIVRAWLAGRDGEFREELYELPQEQPEAYRVAVEQDDRVVALVDVRDWPPGGRVVSSFEACPGFATP